MTKLIRWMLATTAAALVAALACAADTHAAVASAARARGADVISAYAGTWRVEIPDLRAAPGKASKEDHRVMTIENDCWRSVEFFVCHQNVDGESKALLVFAYSAKEDAYSIYPIALGAETVHRGTLIIHGSTWTFPWQEMEHGKTTYFRVINVFTSPDTIEYRTESSTDQVHWVQTATGRERRATAG